MPGYIRRYTDPTARLLMSDGDGQVAFRTADEEEADFRERARNQADNIDDELRAKAEFCALHLVEDEEFKFCLRAGTIVARTIVGRLGRYTFIEYVFENGVDRATCVEAARTILRL